MEPSTSGEGPSTFWDSGYEGLDLPEELKSADCKKFFQFIGSLMTTESEERVVSQEELDLMDMIDKHGSPEGFEKFYGADGDDDDDDDDTAGDGRGISKALEGEDLQVPKVGPRRKRFFGIYQRVKVKLLGHGFIRRSKKLRLMDISANTSVEINYER